MRLKASYENQIGDMNQKLTQVVNEKNALEESLNKVNEDFEVSDAKIAVFKDRNINLSQKIEKLELEKESLIKSRDQARIEHDFQEDLKCIEFNMYKKREENTREKLRESVKEVFTLKLTKDNQIVELNRLNQIVEHYTRQYESKKTSLSHERVILRGLIPSPLY